MEMSIGELASRAGIATSAIRYYEEIGLLPRSARTSGRRVFDDEVLDRLLVIEFAKKAGFTLREIRQLFKEFAPNTTAAERWKKLATSKLAELDAQAQRIETMKQFLRAALRCGCIEIEACGRIFRRARASQMM